MSELDNKLRQFQQAQRELYEYLGIVRHEGDNSQERLRAKRYSHSGGLIDIPSPYPEVLDYRTKQWRIADSDRAGQEEIHIKIDAMDFWEAENIIRFHLYSIWEGEEDPFTHVMGTHLPKPQELEYAHPDEVAKVEAGSRFFGDYCLLLLTSANGYTDLEDYQVYFD